MKRCLILFSLKQLILAAQKTNKNIIHHGDCWLVNEMQDMQTFLLRVNKMKQKQRRFIKNTKAYLVAWNLVRYVAHDGLNFRILYEAKKRVKVLLRALYEKRAEWWMVISHMSVYMRVFHRFYLPPTQKLLTSNLIWFSSHGHIHVIPSIKNAIKYTYIRYIQHHFTFSNEKELKTRKILILLFILFYFLCNSKTIPNTTLVLFTAYIK